MLFLLHFIKKGKKIIQTALKRPVWTWFARSVPSCAAGTGRFVLTSSRCPYSRERLKRFELTADVCSPILALALFPRLKSSVGGGVGQARAGAGCTGGSVLALGAAAAAAGSPGLAVGGPVYFCV